MVVALRVLFVKSWVEDLDPTLAVLRAGGFEVTYERVDIAPALWAALERSRWDVVICDWKTPDLTLGTITQIVREHGGSTPMVILDNLAVLARDVRKVIKIPAAG